MTNRELFKNAIDKVKALNGTAQAKADLFEKEAENIKQQTGGSWSATRMVGNNGEHVFIGGAGELLVIDGVGNTYRGRLDGVVNRFIPPNIVDLDYSSLRPI